MLNPSPATPPAPPKPPARPTRAYDVIFWFLVLGQVLATFTALMAVGTLLVTARPVMRWRIPLPPPAVVMPVDPSGWQTYRNEELGFEVKHPSDWKVTTVENAILFDPPSVDDNAGCSVAVEDNPQRLSLDNWLKQRFNPDEPEGSSITTSREITIAGRNGVLIEGVGPGSFHFTGFFVAHGGRVLEFGYITNLSASGQEYVLACENMLQSFSIVE